MNVSISSLPLYQDFTHKPNFPRVFPGYRMAVWISRIVRILSKFMKFWMAIMYRNNGTFYEDIKTQKQYVQIVPPSVEIRLTSNQYFKGSIMNVGPVCKMRKISSYCHINAPQFCHLEVPLPKGKWHHTQSLYITHSNNHTYSETSSLLLRNWQQDTAFL